jgi:hypothetical protein
MKNRLFWGACFLGLLLVIFSTSITFAASLEQTNEPSPEATELLGQEGSATPLRNFITTLTPTQTLEGGVTATLGAPAATPLPTTTLSPPPMGGGRVAVQVLYIRQEPSFGSSIIGSLFYNDVVLPIGRNAQGDWAAVQWKENVGWLLASLVNWDPALDFQSLTVLSEQTGQPILGSGSPTVLPSTPTLTPIPTHTATLPPTASPSPTLTASPQPSATAVPVPAAPPTPLLPESIWQPLRSGLLIGGGAILLGVIIYLWRRSAGMKEVRRYAHGFLFDTCPVCHEGRLQLDENVLYSMGIPTVRRSVRCSSCRSVLREIRPGRWRYTVDPFVNQAMALRYKTRWLSRADLDGLMSDVAEIRQVTEAALESEEPGDNSDLPGFIEEFEEIILEATAGDPEEEIVEKPLAPSDESGEIQEADTNSNED